jgi:hypothetical protein
MTSVAEETTLCCAVIDILPALDLLISRRSLGKCERRKKSKDGWLHETGEMISPAYLQQVYSSRILGGGTAIIETAQSSRKLGISALYEEKI